MRLRIVILWALVTVSVAGCQSAASKQARQAAERQPLTAIQRQRLLKDIQAIQRLADEGHTGAVKAAFEQLKAELPQIGPFDLSILADAEIAYASRHYKKAARSYQRMLEEYPDSELRSAGLERLYKIGTYYIQGRVIANLILFKIRGYDQGIQILEKVCQEAGLEDPNGLGIKSAVAIADCQERRGLYEEAYLKWSEIAAVWDSGQLGKQALLGMARNKLACYQQHPAQRRHLYSSAHLVAARTYYLRFKSLYPQEAQQMGIDEIIDQIDKDMAFKQLAIAKYYKRIGKDQAANLYLDMVVNNWPQTPAAQTARQLLAADSPRSKD